MRKTLFALALVAGVAFLAAWARSSGDYQILADRALAKAYGKPADSTGHSCTDPESITTLTGGAGKMYRVQCAGAAWIRLGNAAEAAAPSTPLAANQAERFIFEPEHAGTAPLVHCFASSPTTCVYTPLTDVR